MADLKDMFEKSQTTQQGAKIEFTEGETANFKKAFDDPEFRKMFTEYMDEMQNPNNRQETEDYIKQLEGEQKVPQGKELVRPTACFVAKTYKMQNGIKGDKVFVNIVSSESIMTPSKNSTPEGDTWSLPYSLGPPHMEKDKNESNVACFDCCYHPAAIRQMDINKRFRDSLVITAIEGVEEAYKRQKQDTKMSREYHVLKGVSYKQGLIPAMLVDIAAKTQEWNQNGNGTERENTKTAKIEKKEILDRSKSSLETKSAAVGTAINDTNTHTGEIKVEGRKDRQSLDNDTMTSSYGETNISSVIETVAAAITGTGTGTGTDTGIVNEPNQIEKQHQETTITKKSPAIKKGFLTSAKSTIYPESVSAKIKKSSLGNPSTPILLPGKAGKVFGPDSGVHKGGNGKTHGVGDGSGSLVQELTEQELLQLKKTGVVRSPAHSSTLGIAPNSTSTSISSAITPIGLVERVATDKTISNSTVTSNVPLVVLSTTSPSVKCPVYSLIERGIVSMGDFESLKAKVASNRPAELVCKITLPLVTKASLMILDVAERLLKFSYLDTYELSVTLPYPIFDKKGVAKFDKSAKTLTVTMPVQPPVQPNTSSDSLSSHISDIGNNNVGGNIDGVADEEKEKEREKKIGEEKKKNNSRWVGDDSADSREESRRRSEELKREIEARVEESKLMPAPANPTSTSSATVTVDISHSTTSAHSPSSSSTSSASAIASKDFIPSGTFLGRKEGFLFQNGVQGQGYYIDRGGLPAPPPSAPASQSKASSSSSTSATSSSSSSSAAAATAAAVVSPSKGMATDAPKTKGTSSTSALPTQTSSPSPRICRYDYKQTKQAVAVLIHVPHILLNTARVSFLDRTVNVLFEAADCGPDWTTGTRTVHSTETECVHVNPIISGSPTTARITSDNTFINSSVTAAGSKGVTAEIIGNNRDSVLYGFQLISTGILEKSQCKYDIASQNMVIVLTKKEEGYWEESDQSKILSLVSLPEGILTSVKGEKVIIEPELVTLDGIQKNMKNDNNINNDSNNNNNNNIYNNNNNNNNNNYGRKQADYMDKDLIKQVDSMKFSTPVLFDLD